MSGDSGNARPVGPPGPEATYGPGLSGRLTEPGLPVALLLAVALLVPACGGDSPGPLDPTHDLTVRHETGHGVYYHAPGDAIDLAAQEEYYAWLFERLGSEPAEPLVYFKYRNRAHMEEVTGHAGTNGWAEVGTYRFHTISEIDNHESVHALVSSEWNAAPALMNEGFAVAHQALPHLDILDPVWSGTSIDTIAARALRDGILPPVEDLLESSDFRRHETSFIYPIAGSFVKRVIERHGYRAVEAFFRSSDLDDSGERLRSTFRAAFGEEITDAWSEWTESLR